MGVGLGWDGGWGVGLGWGWGVGGGRVSAAHSILIARSLTPECLLGADLLSHHHCAAAGAVCWQKARMHVST